ncbi:MULTISPECIES: DUF4179 domain-containing protein [Solibacillus]|uniref:DUF4179 domain-containing protein n=1 Tax=Solibacillus merdavium TaxID=2762218 RepID=A0ABR8XLZ5_9BACL|nr:DUF4179 domain-containing protein [Solibacillus merdavium]MBD8032961.1 DUF4179 domain-containing protein [Solibacillus merdavium]
MKKFYRKLNDLKIEMDIEPMDVDELEKARIKKNVLKGKKKNNLFRNIAVAASLLLASSFTLSIAFPTYAAKLPIIGSVFELFNEDDRYVFGEYSNYSTDIGISKESNGINITLTDAVYDGENVAIAYTIESEKDLGERPILEGDFIVEEFNGAYEHNGYSENYLTKKIGENEYAVLYVNELIKGPKPSKINVSWEGNSVRNLNNGKQQNSGEWSYQFALQALESETENLIGTGYNTEDTGVAITLIKKTETPISSTFYLSELVDERLVSKEDDEFRGVLIEYNVTDDLGNKQNFIHYRDTGHSTDFLGNVSFPRLTLGDFDNRAKSITITPTVHVLTVGKSDSDGNRPLVPVMAPYEIDPIVFPLNK